MNTAYTLFQIFDYLYQKIYDHKLNFINYNEIYKYRIGDNIKNINKKTYNKLRTKINNVYNLEKLSLKELKYILKNNLIIFEYKKTNNILLYEYFILHILLQEFEIIHKKNEIEYKKKIISNNEILFSCKETIKSIITSQDSSFDFSTINIKTAFNYYNYDSFNSILNNDRTDYENAQKIIGNVQQNLSEYKNIINYNKFCSYNEYTYYLIKLIIYEEMFSIINLYIKTIYYYKSLGITDIINIKIVEFYDQIDNYINDNYLMFCDKNIK